MRSPENPKFWVIDPEAAEIVQRIYDLCLKGYGVDQIGGVLMDEQILSPLNYWKSKGLNRGGRNGSRSPYYWNHSTISKILCQQEYLGDVINFKTYSKSYKDKKRRENAKENMVIFEGVHEPVIYRETWEKVQAKRRKVRARKQQTGERNMFSGLLICATCGSNLGYHFNQGNPDIRYFNCANYNNRASTCNATHYIRVDFLEQIVLCELRRITKFAQQYDESFVKIVMDSALREMEKQGRNRQKELDTLLARDKELDVLFERIYEDSVSGKISEDRFAKMSQKYETEQAELKRKIGPLQQEIRKHNRHNISTEEFLSVVRKYTDLRELTPELVREFVDHIVVHHAEKVGKEKVQRIEIYYKCIGEFKAPDKEDLPNPQITVDTRKGIAVRYSHAS
jgi:hypothetical protein